MTHLVPHRLATPDALIQTGQGADGARWLSYSSGGWTHVPDRADGFVFPSAPLARRYASALLGALGATFVPVPDATATPHVPAMHHCRECGCTETFACPLGCSWHEPDLCSECALPGGLEIWVVYDNPTDYPGKFVARRTLSSVPTEEVLLADSLDELRERAPRGLVVLPRHSGDPAHVVETWL